MGMVRRRIHQQVTGRTKVGLERERWIRMRRMRSNKDWHAYSACALYEQYTVWNRMSGTEIGRI